MKKQTREKIIISLTSLILTLLLCEVCVRFFYGQHLQYRVDSELYWELKPSQYGYQTVGLPFAHINSDGFRGEELSKDLGKERILMLGCSNTFGHALSDQETFPFQLQQMLGSKYEVINGGSPGWGLFQHLERFKRIVSVYNPKVVVLTLITHSPFRQPFKKEAEKKWYLNKMKVRAFLVKSALISLISNLVQKILSSDLGAGANVLRFQDNDMESVWKEDKKRLFQIKKIADEKKIKFILVAYTRLRPRDDLFLKLIKDFEKESGVEVVSNLNQLFLKYSKEDLNAKNDSHPSALANKVLSEQLLKLIKE
jgi:hypothetical protein